MGLLLLLLWLLLSAVIIIVAAVSKGVTNQPIVVAVVSAGIGDAGGGDAADKSSVRAEVCGRIPGGGDSIQTLFAYTSWDCHIPGSSFGRKKVPDLNPAKLSAGFRKKRRRPEKTSGSKILKNR